MEQKIKSILTGVLIGIVVFPTITLGGTFTSSLIQGKTVEEAVQILAEQIDYLTGRVEIIETKQTEIETEQAEVKTKQTEQEQTILELQIKLDKERWCNKMETLSKRIVAGREMSIREAMDYYEQYPPTAEGVLEETLSQYQSYLQAKEQCEK